MNPSSTPPRYPRFAGADLAILAERFSFHRKAISYEMKKPPADFPSAGGLRLPFQDSVFSTLPASIPVSPAAAASSVA